MLYISISCLVDCYTLRSVSVCLYWRKLFSSVQLNIHYIAESCAVEFMYYGRIGTIHKCPDYQVVPIIQFSLHAKASFVTITKYVYIDYASLHINVFYCISVKLNGHLNREKVGLSLHVLSNCFEVLQVSTTK